MNKHHLDHSGEVFGGLFEWGENSSAFFEPSNEPFDDVAFEIRLLL